MNLPLGMVCSERLQQGCFRAILGHLLPNARARFVSRMKHRAVDLKGAL